MAIATLPARSPCLDATLTIYAVHIYKDGQHDRVNGVHLEQGFAQRSAACYNRLSDGDGYEARVRRCIVPSPAHELTATE